MAQRTENAEIARIRAWRDELTITPEIEGGIQHGWSRDVDTLLAEVDRLTRVAIAARDVLTTVHDGFREEIDFVPLWRALIEAGLMPVDPADWVGEEVPVPPAGAPSLGATTEPDDG